jgi:hypothetical protein
VGVAVFKPAKPCLAVDGAAIVIRLLRHIAIAGGLAASRVVVLDYRPAPGWQIRP